MKHSIKYKSNNDGLKATSAPGKVALSEWSGNGDITNSETAIKSNLSFSFPRLIAQLKYWYYSWAKPVKKCDIQNI